MTLTPAAARVLDFCKRRPAVTIEALCSSLSVAPITVRRALKTLGYFSSFNHNARYYTLAERPCFDANGLWFYRTIGFSRHQTLCRTLVALVAQAPTGLTPEELSALLRTPVGNLLPRLANEQQLARRRLGRCTVYLAVDAAVQQQQWQQRLLPCPAPMVPDALPDAAPVELLLPFLVEWIRSPKASLEQLRRRRQRDGVALSAQQAKQAAEYFQLEKKEAH
jgi:hypothetical protein